MSHSITETRQCTPMWVYERNFGNLLKLIPDLMSQSEGSLFVAQYNSTQVTAQVLENNRYTQDIELREVTGGKGNLINALQLKIRIYYDAQLAEVISYQGHPRLRSRYDYPNPSMHHPDEKRQSNYLLNDWLSLFEVDDFRLDEACLCPEF